MKPFLKKLLFIFCLVSLLVSMQIFYNQGIIADELNLRASQLFGGDLWLLVNWLRMFTLFLATILSFVNLFPVKKPTQQ